MRPGFKKVVSGLVAGIMGATVALILLHFGLLDHIEGQTFDLRVRALARPGKATDDIRLILLDQKSLDWAKENFGLGWPWPRQAYVPAVDFCRQAGAASLAFDVVFTEPSVYGVSDDQALSQAFEQMGRVVLAADFARKDGSATRWPTHIPKPGLTAPTNGDLARASVATFPIPDLTAGIQGVGNVNVPPDPDTIYRHIPLAVRFGETIVPSLPLASYISNGRPIALKITAGRLTIGTSSMFVTQQGRSILQYRGKNGYKAFSAAAVMESGMRLAQGEEPVIDPSEFKGKHVLFGFSATGLLDLRPTPMGGVSPGVVVNATALDNLLSNDFMTRTGLWYEIATILLFALLAGVSVTLPRALWAAIAASVAALGAPVVTATAAYRMGYWAGLAPQLAGCAGSLFLAGAIKYATEGRQKRFIKSAFKQYLSPKVIDQLLQHPERLTLGGERRELTIFFSDLQGFTSISEGLSPEELTAVLNDYLTAMTDIIQETGGTVDKYEGDAIIAFWNAPVDQPDHARRAVSAALRCQEKLAAMRPELLERTGHEFHMRIGLNTGHAVVGNLGSHDRFDYTMLGDAVNLAARLESVNKQFDTYTMISQATLDQLDDTVSVRELSCLRVVGKAEPVRVYEPMRGDAFRAKEPTYTAFADGLKLFYLGDFTKAETVFADLEDMDPPARKYRLKCQKLLQSPPEDWDGVWTMDRK